MERDCFAEDAGAPAGVLRILLVEDDLHVAETLGELLALEGFGVVVAHDADSGFALARSERPDLVLCDLTLAGALNGLGFAAACRSDAALRGLRLMAISGYCRTEDRKRAVGAGFDGLIAKPVDLSAIHAAFRPMQGAAA